MDLHTFETMPVNWIFLRNNGPKHSAMVVEDWLLKEKILLLAGLNPIENLWNDVKVQVGQKKFKDCDELWGRYKRGVEIYSCGQMPKVNREFTSKM